MRRAQGQPPCTLSSTTAGELMLATAAASTENWVLLEVTGGWAPKAPATRGLPSAVTNLWAHVAQTPRARMLFIKQKPRTSPSRRIFIGNSGKDPWWITWSLPNLEAVGEIDIDAIWKGQIPAVAEAVTEPLYLVCTHGKRDACCAKFGIAMYRALCDQNAARVWQASHIGGHRFAATLLAFPTGHCFGRLAPADAQPLYEAFENHSLWSLGHIRGRTMYNRPEQAAIQFLRQHLSQTEVTGIELTSPATISTAGNEWTVRLKAQHQHYVVTVKSTPGKEIFGSCFKEKRQAALQWSASIQHSHSDRG